MILYTVTRHSIWHLLCSRVNLYQTYTKKQQYLQCAVLILTGDCDFESKYLCDWFNDEENDEFDWRVISGKTGSTGTGPTSDHTTNSTTGIKIMY